MPSKKRSESSDWRARDRRVLWHPFTQQSAWETEDFPVLVRGDGSWLIDVDGNRYLDGVSSLWCNLVGHRRREIDEAVARQVGMLAHATFLGATNPPAIELAERLVALAPKGLARVFYSDDGSTAMEVALKIAFQYWQQNGKPGRTKFVALTEGYHGDTVGAMSAGGVELFHSRYRPLLFQVIRASTTYAYRCTAGAKTLEECGKHCLEELEAILKTHAHEVCGVVLEPLVQGAGGMIVQPKGFLGGVRDLCRRHDLLLIADEVMTGFGRTGTMFACEQEGVVPDLMALSKGLTGGYLPLAATLATERVYDGFLGPFEEMRAFFHGHTFTGNPLGCAAGLAVLDFLEKDRTLEKLKPKIARFQERIAALGARPNVGDVRLCGLIAGIELVRDKATKESFPYAERAGHRAILKARERGVLLRPLGNTIVVMPPLTIAPKELDMLLDTVEAIV